MSNKIEINPVTGEKFDLERISNEQASDMLRPLLVYKKKIEDLEKKLKDKLQPVLDESIQFGEKKLFNFWDVQKGRMMFDSQTFKKEADEETQMYFLELKESIREIENKYLKVTKPFIKFPKL